MSSDSGSAVLDYAAERLRPSSLEQIMLKRKRLIEIVEKNKEEFKKLMREVEEEEEEEEEDEEVEGDEEEEEVLEKRTDPSSPVLIDDEVGKHLMEQITVTQEVLSESFNTLIEFDFDYLRKVYKMCKPLTKVMCNKAALVMLITELKLEKYWENNPPEDARCFASSINPHDFKKEEPVLISDFEGKAQLDLTELLSGMKPLRGSLKQVVQLAANFCFQTFFPPEVRLKHPLLMPIPVRFLKAPIELITKVIRVDCGIPKHTIHYVFVRHFNELLKSAREEHRNARETVENEQNLANGASPLQ